MEERIAAEQEERKGSLARRRRFSLMELTRIHSVDDALLADQAGIAAPIDMERIAMRLDGFEMYAFLASLTAGFSFNCLNEFDALPEFEKRCPSRMLYYPVAFAFSFSLVASIFCGLYTTCVFALCSLYAKTALAEQSDARMRSFLQETACALRRRAGTAHPTIS